MRRLFLLSAVAAGSLVLCPRDTSSYVLYGAGAKWGGGALGTTSGGDVNWMFHEAGTPDMAGGPLTSDGEYSVLVSCLLEWEDATGGNLDLQYTGTTTLTPVTGDTNHIAYWMESGWTWGSSAIGLCSFDYSGTTMNDADVFFNGQNFTWTDSTLMRKVALHEFGHAIGLGHETTNPAIMQPVVGSSSTLLADDIAGARALYGLGGGGDGVTAVPPPPPPPPDPNPGPDPGGFEGTPTPPPSGGGGGGGGSSSSQGVDWSDDGPHREGGVVGFYRHYRNKYCIVATAAFGSPDASRINILRDMRDRSLRATESGGRFVSLYENAAAPGAQVVKKSEVLRALVRRVLP